MILSIALRIVGVALLAIAASLGLCSVWGSVQAYSSARLNESVNFGGIGGLCTAVVGMVLAMAGVLLYRRGVKRRQRLIQ
jgi:hypothetical protein